MGRHEPYNQVKCRKKIKLFTNRLFENTFVSFEVRQTYSLSKCSNYPNSIREILAMSQNSIREILAMSSKKYFQLINFLSNFSSIHEKIQTPWTIQFYVVKNTSMKIFLWSKKHKFLNLAMFSKNIEKFWDIAKISRILFG